MEEAPATAQVFDGHKLQQKVRVQGSGTAIGVAAIKRAEEALEELSPEFDGWMGEEVHRLIATHDAIAAGGYQGEAAEQFFRVAHDLKGEAETLGYPLITRICASLCILLETVENAGAAPPLNLFLAHVEAIRALHRQRIKGSTHKTAIAIFHSLAEATDRFLAANQPRDADGFGRRTPEA